MLHCSKCSPEINIIKIMVCYFLNNYMLMSLQICKVFYIFVLYFQTLLIKIESSLLDIHFNGTRYSRVIITATCPHGSNVKNLYQHGSNIPRIKWSRNQDVLHVSCYTTYPSLKLRLTLTKNYCSYKNCTRSEYIPSELL